MSEKPILFNGEMVRAILDGTKTQTRRPMKEQPGDDLRLCKFPSMRHGEFWFSNGSVDYAPSNPFGSPGDSLWVRETFIQGWPCENGDLQQFDEDGNELPKHVWYRSKQHHSGGWVSTDGAMISCWMDDDGWMKESIPWKPSIHMPRWASRINLKVKRVWVERVQDISNQGVYQEGSPGLSPCQWGERWDRIYAKQGLSWTANPWVWCCEFEVVA